MDHKSSETVVTHSENSEVISDGQPGCSKRKRRQSVYFVQCNGDGGPIKIGIAVDAMRRVSELRIGCPYSMELLGVAYAENAEILERRLHLRFAPDRIHGEWFTCSTELLELAAEARSTGANVAADALGLPRYSRRLERKR